MVHKSTIIPGLSQFLDNTVLSHYPPTSLKRIIAAGAIALYLKQNDSIVDVVINNPLFNGLGVSNASGMVDIDTLYNIYKAEVVKAGYIRVNFPILGAVDFTPDDLDTLCKCIKSIDNPSAGNM